MGFAAFGDTYSDLTAKGAYRPEWTWIAIRDDDDTVVARAAWWAGPTDSKPLALDRFDFTDFDAAVQLLRAAPLRTEYQLKPARLARPPGGQPGGHRAHQRGHRGRHAGARRALRLPLDPGLRPAATPGRLVFRPEPDDAVILEVFGRIHQGSLDAHVRRTVAEQGLEAAAQEDLDILGWVRGPRGWWRLACASGPGGDLVGDAVPTRNYHDPVVGNIGVVPEHRGNGYAYDLLVEATHLLAAEGPAGSWRPPTWRARRWPSPSPGPATRSISSGSTWCGLPR